MSTGWTPETVVTRIAEEARQYEFRTFVVGFERPRSSKPYEESASVRKLKIAVGTELLKRWPLRAVDFTRPEIRFDVRSDLEIKTCIAPLYLAGRYRKLSREIPSSRWIHHPCRGRGCESCRNSGELNGPSVQEILSHPVLGATDGEGTALHAMGREDTDARMLGDGRPFVLEVTRPRRRTLDLRAIVGRATRDGRGLAEFLTLRIVDRTAVRLIKETAADKSYRAWIETEGSPPADAKRRVESLGGQTIRQLSPSRVMHRRGRKSVRLKRILESRWLGAIEGKLVWELRTESGTYIKELVSGDSGRTSPSLREILGVPARCTALDVIAIHWHGL